MTAFCVEFRFDVLLDGLAFIRSLQTPFKFMKMDRPPPRERYGKEIASQMLLSRLHHLVLFAEGIVGQSSMDIQKEVLMGTCNQGMS